MVKVIRKPITDIHGRDFSTGKVMKVQLCDRTKEHMAKSRKDFKAKEKNAKGEVYVAGFGRVK